MRDAGSVAGDLCASGSLGFVKRSVANLNIPGCLLVVSAMLTVSDAQAEGCPTPADEIATDRPDVTNSSLVVPVGSFQSENGINLTARDGGRTFDGTNSRWRLGVAPCFEVFVDLPNYFSNIKSPGLSGFSDVAPAVKLQISPVPGKIDLSMTMGVLFPTGPVEIAGRGAPALPSISVVMGIARRLGSQRYVHRVLPPSRLQHETRYRNDFCYREEADREVQSIYGVCGRLPGRNYP